MIHTSWTARDGAPQAIKAIAQGTDRTLWIGSDAGLFQFDGVTFTRFQPLHGDPQLPTSGVESLCVLRDGSIWVGMNGEGAAHIINGHVVLSKTVDGQPLNVVQDIRQAPNGSVYAVLDQRSLIRFAEGTGWHQINLPRDLKGSGLRGFFFDSTGTLWIPWGGKLYKRPFGTTAYVATSIKADLVWGSAEASDGSLWVTDVVARSGHGRTQHFDRHGVLIETLRAQEQMMGLLALPNGFLWLATQEKGLRWFKPHDASTVPSADPSESKGFTHLDGLSSDSVRALLRDTDGSLWSAGKRGLDRFREPVLRPFPPSMRPGIWSICKNEQGNVWIAGAANVLYEGTSGLQWPLKENSGIFSIGCGRDGVMWTVDQTGVWRMQSGQQKLLPSMPGARNYTIRQIVESQEHVVYAIVGTPLSGSYRYQDGTWTKLSGKGIIDASPISQFIDSQGRLWAGYSGGRVGLPLEGQGRVLSSGSPGLGMVYAFAETSYGMLAAGMNGVAVFSGNDFRTLTLANPLAACGVTGIVESSKGDVWLNAVQGLVRITASEFRSAMKNPTHPVQSEMISEGDFVGPAPLLRQAPSAVRDVNGRLWFSMLNGVVSVDPEHVHSSIHPPLISIRSIEADEQPLDDRARFKPNPQRLFIRYFGLNLTAPEEVIYKYKLQGVDKNWLDAGHRTEAAYTHVSPGTYRFWVMASNNGSEWTTPLPSPPFTILPSFYQTWWFRVAGIVTTAIFILSIITARVRRVATLIKARAEERADERVRIARDLHDTLLQGIQGLLLSFHVATLKVAAHEESRPLLERAMATADRIIIEGRNQINRLRFEHIVDAELVEHIEKVAADLDLDGSVSYNVMRQGSAAVLQDHVANEIYYVAREALTNAFRHSEATSIKVLLDYEKRCFTMTCRDNGCGIDEEVMKNSPKAGHWGFHGMAERTRGLGGTLGFESQVRQGTEIKVKLPAGKAYIRRGLVIDLVRRALGKPSESRQR